MVEAELASQSMLREVRNVGNDSNYAALILPLQLTGTLRNRSAGARVKLTP